MFSYTMTILIIAHDVYDDLCHVVDFHGYCRADQWSVTAKTTIDVDPSTLRMWPYTDENGDMSYKGINLSIRSGEVIGILGEDQESSLD